MHTGRAATSCVLHTDAHTLTHTVTHKINDDARTTRVRCCGKDAARPNGISQAAEVIRSRHVVGPVSAQACRGGVRHANEVLAKFSARVFRWR
jgi:hypothetical protein